MSSQTVKQLEPWISNGWRKVITDRLPPAPNDQPHVGAPRRNARGALPFERPLYIDAVCMLLVCCWSGSLQRSCNYRHRS